MNYKKEKDKIITARINKRITMSEAKRLLDRLEGERLVEFYDKKPKNPPLLA
jgi:hypothetical protein